MRHFALQIIADMDLSNTKQHLYLGQKQRSHVTISLLCECKYFYNFPGKFRDTQIIELALRNIRHSFVLYAYHRLFRITSSSYLRHFFHVILSVLGFLADFGKFSSYLRHFLQLVCFSDYVTGIMTNLYAVEAHMRQFLIQATLGNFVRKIQLSISHKLFAALSTIYDI